MQNPPSIAAAPAAEKPPLFAVDWSGFDRVIAPSASWAPLNLKELWEYRELLYFLAWRDIKVRYKQTVLGASWAILQPFLTMIVFSLFFGRLAGIGRMVEGGIPYSIFAFAGLVPWALFANGLTQSAESLVGGANLIKKVYFPRLVLPIAAVVTGLVDFCLALLVLFAMMAWYHIYPTAAAWWLPLLVLLAIVSSLAVGFWLAALNVQYRDVRYTLSFLTQLWMFSTPIAYPSTLLGEPWRSIYGLNPMAGVVEGFRWALLGSSPPGPILWVSAIGAVTMLVGGVFYFRRMERTFADRV